jgi:hypothetical protein
MLQQFNHMPIALSRQVLFSKYYGILSTMGKKIQIDVTELGRKGGAATAANRTALERTTASSAAAAARWTAYYAKNPDKLRAKLAREAKKGTVPRGRPKKKSAAKKGKATT